MKLVKLNKNSKNNIFLILHAVKINKAMPAFRIQVNTKRIQESLVNTKENIQTVVAVLKWFKTNKATTS